MSRVRYVVCGSLFVIAVLCQVPLAAAKKGAAAPPALPRLRVDATQRTLETSAGAPFTYIGDTAWGMFTELSSADRDYYLQNRVSKGFTVIQAVALWDVCAGFSRCDISSPNRTYWKNIDQGINKAEGLGLYVALLPTWGSVVTSGLLDEFTAEAYGRFLGARYRDHPLIWVLGGDTVPIGYEAVWRALARGLAIGQNGSEKYTGMLMTFHPGPYWDGSRWCVSAACWFRNDPWLSFTMLQTGHCNECTTYGYVAEEYARTPTRPVIVGEPGYENIPDYLIPANRLLSADSAERFAYGATFAGAFGHAYGANEVYGFWDPGDTGWGYEIWGASLPWRAAMELPGAARMGTLRTLLSGRLRRMPDQTLVLSQNPDGLTHVQATRAVDRTFALFYIPDGRTITLNGSALSTPTLTCTWLNPRDGSTTSCGIIAASVQVMSAPTVGESWVLMLDAR